MREEIKQKIQKIADTYGYDSQSRQCIEEMAELTQAINKFWRKGLDCGRKEQPNGQEYINMHYTFDDLVEEIADAQIMLWQMEYLLNADKSIIIERKLDRQIKRIEESEV